MYEDELVMYEQLSIDDELVGYADAYRCNECRRFIEAPPITDPDGNRFCSQLCLEDYHALEEDLQELTEETA